MFCTRCIFYAVCPERNESRQIGGDQNLFYIVRSKLLQIVAYQYTKSICTLYILHFRNTNLPFYTVGTVGKHIVYKLPEPPSSKISNFTFELHEAIDLKIKQKYQLYEAKNITIRAIWGYWTKNKTKARAIRGSWLKNKTKVRVTRVSWPKNKAKARAIRVSWPKNKTKVRVTRVSWPKNKTEVIAARFSHDLKITQK